MAQKHDDYANPCVVTITKRHQRDYDYDFYELTYEDEGWTLMGMKEDVIKELSEHMDNMKGE